MCCRTGHRPGGGGGGKSHIRGVGMLVVSFKGVNLGFCSHLGCSGQNAIIFSRKGLFYLVFLSSHTIPRHIL